MQHASSVWALVCVIAICVLQAAQALGQRGEGMGSVKKSDSSVRNLAMLVEVPSLGGKFDDTSASKLVLSRFANSKEGGKTEKVAWVDLEPANPFSKARVDEGYKQWMPQSLQIEQALLLPL